MLKGMRDKEGEGQQIKGQYGELGKRRGDMVKAVLKVKEGKHERKGLLFERATKKAYGGLQGETIN